MPAAPISRFAFARAQHLHPAAAAQEGDDASTARHVALTGTPLDAKPCAIFSFTLRPGKHPMQIALAISAIRNPPPPGLTSCIAIAGATTNRIMVLNVFDSYAAIANALARTSPQALQKLSGIIEFGGDIWVGPVSCIPSTSIPRPAVVRALLRGADVIALPRRWRRAAPRRHGFRIQRPPPARGPVCPALLGRSAR